MEDDFDFEEQFADELDAMKDMDMDFEVSQRTVSRTASSINKIPELQSQSKSLPSNDNSSHNEKSTTMPSSQTSAIDALNRTGRHPSPSSQPENGSVLDGPEDGERRSKKRDVEEMFGPMSDDDSDNELVIDAPLPDIAPTAKRARKLFQETSNGDDPSPPPSPTADEKAIEKVMEHRKKTQTQRPQPEHTGAPSVQEDGRRRETRILLREPAGLSMRLTGQDGRRVFLKMKDAAKVEERMTKTNGISCDGGPLCLLARPVDLMRDDMENERMDRILKEAEKISSSFKTDLSKSQAEDSLTNDDPLDENEGDTSQEKSDALWVDQYAPKRYTELLSDDGINRNLLFWLKLWDPLVFGTERKQRKKPQQQQQQQADNKTKTNKHFKSKFQQEETQEELDEHDRPVHKTALLCGPPGLGKTTLAHIIAKHAGYNVVEMNASDDRSVEVFKNKLETSTQMQSVLITDRRPNCLVIDEIDGAPAPAINCLLTFIKGAADSVTSTDSEGTSGKKKKQKMLLRPIVCICNDPYVPALRQLRQQAFVTHFPPTLTTRLASRLNQIARNNALRTDMTALMALCSKADNDIRSCLNTLQFIHSQGNVLSLALVNSLSVGQKDRHKGFFAIWQDIFKLPQAKRKQYTNPHDIATGKATTEGLPESAQSLDQNNPVSLSARFYNILQVAQGAGDYEKLMQGIFENYLEMKFKDPRLEALNIASDWLVFHDRLGSVVGRTQNYIFYRYLPFVPILFHLLFASSAQPRLKYPNTSYENSVKKTKTENLLTTVLSEVAPSTACFLDVHKAVTEILPLLLIILQPTFRPVNTQLFNAQEKRQLKELVNTMIAYNLTYNQERSAEGQYNYVLDPNLDSVVRYSNAAPTKQITYAAKQLIAREISLEKMRRSEALRESKQDSKDPKGSKKSAVVKKDGRLTAPKVPRHLEKLQPKKIEEEPEKPQRDFFGRIIQPKPKTKPDQSNNAPGATPSQAEKDEHLSGKLWYKFNQGFSNAVRKTVRIQDLL